MESKKILQNIIDYKYLLEIISYLEEYIVLLEDKRRKSKFNINQDNININPLLNSFLESIDLKVDDISSAQKLKESLVDIKKNAKIFTVILSDSPNDDLRRKIAIFFFNSVSQHRLIKFNVSPDIGGGIVLKTPTRYFDFSYYKMLEGSEDDVSSLIKQYEI
jgi:F0F1-type ATP synthase delta subunit